MKNVVFLLVGVLWLIGCGGGSSGGGGGGVSTTIVGQVLDVTTGGAVVGASVTAAGFAAATTQGDGSFSLTAGPTTTSVVVDTTSYGAWTFPFTGSSGTVDLGQLWVGPSRVSLSGTIIDSTTGLPVGNSTVSFAGISTTAAGNGKFTLSPVPYNGASLPVFWGIVGSVTNPSYFTDMFTASGVSASGGVVALGDILVTPSNDPNPPGQPYSISGVVEPVGPSTGTVVTLLSGGVPVRVFNVGATGQYTFWIGPGSYTITYKNGSQSAPTQSVTVVSLGTPVTVPPATLH